MKKISFLAVFSAITEYQFVENMIRKFGLALCGVVLTFVGLHCSDGKENRSEENISPVEYISCHDTTYIDSCKCVVLETTQASLIGSIGQIKVYQGEF